MVEENASGYNGFNMHILISETDPIAAQLLSAHLSNCGHESSVAYMTPTNLGAFTLFQYDMMIMVCPQTLPHWRSFVGKLRAITPQYPYIVLIVPDAEPLAPNSISRRAPPPALLGGINATLRRPFDFGILDEILDNATRFRRFIAQKDKFTKTHSSSFSIPNLLTPSVFNQIMFCALDRTARGRGNVSLVTIALHADADSDPQDTYLHALAAALLRIHRGSELLGQIGPHHLALLLQDTRSAYEIIATHERVAACLCACPELAGQSLHIMALSLPGAQKLAEHHIVPQQTNVGLALTQRGA